MEKNLQEEKKTNEEKEKQSELIGLTHQARSTHQTWNPCYES